MVNIISNDVSFRATCVPSSSIKSKSIRGACKIFEQSTTDSNNVMKIEPDKLGYRFSMDNNIANIHTQMVGKDTMGYILMEKTPKEIARFFETVLDVLKTRSKFGVNENMTEIENPNYAAAKIFQKDPIIGKQFNVYNEYTRKIDLTNAGHNIHIY